MPDVPGQNTGIILDNPNNAYGVGTSQSPTLDARTHAFDPALGGIGAVSVSYVPTGTIGSTDVQAAITEVNTEAVHLAGTETITGVKDFTADLGLKYKGVTVARVNEGPLSLLDPRVNADNTGATNMAAAWAAAVALLPGGVGHIYAPPGSYRHDSALNFTGIVVDGASRVATVFVPTGAGTKGFVTTAGVRSGTLQHLGIAGATGSGDLIEPAANFGHLRFIDLALSPVAGAKAVDCSAGNAIDVYMESVRAEGVGATATQWLFDFDASAGTAINGLNAKNCYANNGAGGWSLANVAAAVLETCSADNNNTVGYQVGGGVHMIGCTAEANDTGGLAILGVGDIILDHFRTYAQILPIRIAAAANVHMRAPQSVSTPSGASLTVTSAATNPITLENEDFDVGMSLAAGAYRVRRPTAHGQVYSNATPVGNVLTGQDDLMSYTLPAGVLGQNGNSVRITAQGVTGANANNKTILMYFGGVLVGGFGPVALNSQDWVIEVVLTRGTATFFRGWYQQGSSQPATQPLATGSLSGAVADLDANNTIIKCTGEGTLTNDVEQRSMTVEVLS